MDRLAFIFPGSGSQYVGMGSKLYEEFAVFRETLDEAGDVLGKDLKKICFEGSTVKLNRIENMLPAIFAVSIGTFRVYQETIGASPAYMAGHSLGEYSALCCSGALNFADMLRIVEARSLLAKKAAALSHGVMSVLMNVDPGEIDSICAERSFGGKYVGIACYNSPSQVMISGDEELVLQVEQAALALKGKVIPMIGSAPYHSPLMGSILDEYAEELGKYKFQDLSCPVISNLEALPYPSKEHIYNGLLEQMIKPVLWKQTVEYLESAQVSAVIEIGPQNVLKMLTMENTGQMKVLSYIDKTDQLSLQELAPGRQYALIKTTISQMCNNLLATTKNYSNDSNDRTKAAAVWSRLNEQLDADQPFNEERAVRIVRMLKEILDLKHVPEREQQSKIKPFLVNTELQDIWSKAQIVHRALEETGV